MESSALPLGEYIVLALLAPPIVSCLWFLMSRRRAEAIQGGKVSETTKKRQKIGFFVLLVSSYIIMFGIKIYSLFVR
jgi:hypothetical protein